MSTLRETKRDTEIIDEILRRNPALRDNRSAAIRVALESWAEQNMSAQRQEQAHHEQSSR